jgi:hypothetical protein
MNFGTFIFVGIFVFTIGRNLIRVKKAGGLKAGMLGGKVRQTHGTITTSPPVGSMTLTVHELEGKNGHDVAVEIKRKSGLSYSVTPITLSIAEAQQLARLLNSATTIGSAIPPYGSVQDN